MRNSLSLSSMTDLLNPAIQQLEQQQGPLALEKHTSEAYLDKKGIITDILNEIIESVVVRIYLHYLRAHLT